jgi:hypothetical protein
MLLQYRDGVGPWRVETVALIKTRALAEVGYYAGVAA